MKKEIYAYLKKHYGTEPSAINRCLVSAFVYENNWTVEKNTFLKAFVLDENDEKLTDLLEFIHAKKVKFDFENLIEYFEFVISPEDKVINGAIYTPQYIRDFIVEESFKKYPKRQINKCTVGDFACGCGCFLYSSAKKIKAVTNKTYFDIFKDQIFGLDITEYSIERTKILLSLLALSEGEDVDFDFNLFVGNALSFDWKKECTSIKKSKGFDFVLGNPPYVSAKNLADESRALLKNWSVGQVGNPDLYIPFFQIGIENLKANGVLGYITVNSFIRSLNGRLLRKYLQDRKPKFDIIDFGDDQVFQGRVTYTCICLLTNMPYDSVGYINIKSKQLQSKWQLSYTDYDDLTIEKGWQLGSKETVNIISRIESNGKPLGEVVGIRNGFATLRNSIYLFKPIEETKDVYILEKDGGYIEIEKAICRDAIKANILKTDRDINRYKEKIIFPYTRQLSGQTKLFSNEKALVQVVSEQRMQDEFPKTYDYLSKNKEILAHRDKGKKNYAEWYAYGRNQALAIDGYKLLFPCYSDKPYFVLSDDENLLFYNGYALVSNDWEQLCVLQKVLSSSLFWFYIKHVSKPYTNDYFAMSKNFIKNFGLCHLSKAEQQDILLMTDKIDMDRFLSRKYKIPLHQFSEYAIHFDKTALVAV